MIPDNMKGIFLPLVINIHIASLINVIQYGFLHLFNRT